MFAPVRHIAAPLLAVIFAGGLLFTLSGSGLLKLFSVAWQGTYVEFHFLLISVTYLRGQLLWCASDCRVSLSAFVISRD